MVNRNRNNRSTTVLLLLIVAGLLFVYLLANATNKPDSTMTPPGQEQTTPGQATPGPTTPEQATPVPTSPGQATPGQATPTDSVEWDEQGPEVHFLDVGEGSSILILYEGESILIDGGGRTASSYVVSYLERRGVERLSLIVATHYDSDHINGLIGALRVYGAPEVLGPDYAEETKTYNSFVSAVEDTGALWTHPEAGWEKSFGNLHIRVLSIGKPSYDDNDQSLMLMIEYGGVRMLVGGDATLQREEQLLESGQSVDCDIYYVSHHGSNSSSGKQFLQAMSPDIAVVSVGENGYGHPHPACIERLGDVGATIYRTDEQGAIVMTMHGGGYTITTER